MSLTDLFSRLLSMSLTGGAAVLIVCLARLCLKRAPRWISYLLWFAVLFRLLCPVSFTASFSLIPASLSSGPCQRTFHGIGHPAAFAEPPLVGGLCGAGRLRACLLYPAKEKAGRLPCVGGSGVSLQPYSHPLRYGHLPPPDLSARLPFGGRTAVHSAA